MIGQPSICSPGPAAGVASPMRAGPGRKVFRIRKSLRDMPAIIVIEESILGKVADV